MAEKIKYKSGSQRKYDAFETYDANTMYWCIDTGKLYRGDIDFTESVRFCGEHTGLELPARNILYFDSDGSGWVYYKNADTKKDEWKQVIGTTGESVEIVIATAITETSTNNEVAGAKAVYDLFQNLQESTLTDEDLKEISEKIVTIEETLVDVATWSEM